MENWWNDTNRGKSKYLYRNLSQCQIFHHKLHMDGYGIDPVPPQSDVGY
jgi:hypothetical protein